LRGRVTLVARVDHADRVQEVDFQLSEEDGDSWLTVASATAEPFEAPFDTTVLADGRYELRASAVTRDGQTGATAARPHRIDNTPPLVRLDVPDKGFIAGTVQLEARAHDEGSGVESILIELRPEEGRWSDLARVEEEPVLEHTWDTSKLADGHYDLRVVARDRAGNARRPELVALVVDNTPPLAEIVSPDEGDRVDGIVPIGAEIVDSCSGLAWLRYEWARGDGEWHELPRGAGSVVWQTAEVEDGEYLLRVRAADRAGNATTSEAVAITIANEPRCTEPEPVEDEEPEADAATRFGPVPSWSAEDDAVQPDSESEAEPEPDLEPEPEPEAFTLSAVPPPDLEAEPEPEPEPEPESEPEAEPEPEQTVVVLPRSARHWSLWELDSLTEEHAGDDPFRTEERRAILYFLRDHAALDGSIPDEFAPVVAETFGDLLD
jgi:hypothetical protein